LTLKLLTKRSGFLGGHKCLSIFGRFGLVFTWRVGLGKRAPVRNYHKFMYIACICECQKVYAISYLKIVPMTRSLLIKSLFFGKLSIGHYYQFKTFRAIASLFENLFISELLVEKLEFLCKLKNQKYLKSDTKGV
jgi:hypothetical protein